MSNDRLGPVSDSVMSIGPWDYALFLTQSSSPASPTGQFSHANRNGHQWQSITPFHNIFETHFLDNVPMIAGSDPSSRGVNSLTSPEDSSENPMCLPSLREIRELNSTPLQIYDMCELDKGESAENHSRILEEIQSFFTAIVSTRSEIAGISSAVAEYLAWVRRVPGMPREPNCAAVLGILETRVPELHEVAENRQWAAWRQALEKLDVTRTELNMFETETHNGIAETVEYFHVSYDIDETM